MVDSPSSDAWPGPNLRLGQRDADDKSVDKGDARRELESLYRTHFVKVAGYFRRCGIQDAVARELAQETFVNALKGLHQFQGQSKLSTWLWTIARNVFLGHLRSRKAELGDSDTSELDIEGLTNGDDPRLTVVCDCVRRGFAAFSAEHPERAEVIYLAVVEGWTREELAAFLGRTPHAATEYLSQCKARLRPYIEGCDER